LVTHSLAERKALHWQATERKIQKFFQEQRLTQQLTIAANFADIDGAISKSAVVKVCAPQPRGNFKV
jgi:hypothetical protein